MGRVFNYFVGMLTSRMAIYAYVTGSGVTTTVLYIGYLNEMVTVQTRLVEKLPLFFELFGRVAVPLWIPPITEIDMMMFLSNVFFGLCALFLWSLRYALNPGYRRY